MRSCGWFFPRILQWLVALGLSLLAAGCIEYGIPNPQDAGTDGGQPVDSVPDSGTDSGPLFDSDPGAFCSGEAKVALGGQIFEPVTVTTDQLVMDCCDGFLARFHLPAQGGSSLAVMARWFAGALPIPGDFTFDGTQAGNLAVVVSQSGSSESQPLKGTLRLEGDGSGTNSTVWITLCAEAAGDGPLAGTRLWVERTVLAPWSTMSRWQILQLKDTSLNAVDAAKLPLDTLELGQELVNLDTIDYYAAQSHTLVWNSWHTTASLLNQIPQVGVFGVPFVVAVDSTPIYLGAFYTALSSVSFPGPVIMVDAGTLSSDHVTIEPSYAEQPATPDPRADPRILAVLRETGKLGS